MFNNIISSITKVDIEESEKIIGFNLSEEQKEVIKNDKTCYYQACPGSGKTTTLVTKLITIANKLPETHQGICVLSHTNAAREEIEKKLLGNSKKILSHPNFIGTIQSFIDKYLAIPCMIEEFKIRPSMIDTDESNNQIKRTITRNTLYFLEQNFGKEKINSAFKKISFDFNNINNLQIYSDRNFKAGSGSNSYKEVRTIKNKLIAQGCISYEDALALANCYLKKYPCIADTIRKRFPLVFIDEMQDTNNELRFLIEKIFLNNEGNSIVQLFGDNNQNLYNPSVMFDDEISKIKTELLSKTYRLCPSIINISQNICKVRQSLERDMNYEICNNRKCKNCGKCSNTIILLNNNSIDQALPTFTNIIKEVKEKKFWKNKNNKDSYYAIGAIGKSNENKEYLTIKSYCSTYEKDFKSNTKMLNLNWYFELAQEELITTKSCKTFKESVIYGLVNLINKNQYKYNKNEFIKLLNEEFISVKNALNIKIIEWTEFLYFNSINSNNWDNFIKDIFDILKEFNIDKNNNNVKKFIKYQEFYNTASKGNEKTKNIYTNPETGISVKLSTIHGVKGQTHDATLLLETHCYGHSDIEELFELILNKDNEKEYDEIIKNLSNKTKDKSLPAVYVAITRPKHLLCIAMREGVLSNEFKINTLIKKLEKELENKKLEKTKEKYRNNIYKLQQEKQENKEKNTKKLQELGWNIVYARSPKE